MSEKIKDPASFYKKINS